MSGQCVSLVGEYLDGLQLAAVQRPPVLEGDEFTRERQTHSEPSTIPTCRWKDLAKSRAVFPYCATY